MAVFRARLIPPFSAWRTYATRGSATSATTWDVPQNKGVRWKAAIPGLGHSSPIVWGNRVCLTTAISGKPDAGIKIGLYGDIASVPDDTVHTWKLMCLESERESILLRHRERYVRLARDLDKAEGAYLLTAIRLWMQDR